MTPIPTSELGTERPKLIALIDEARSGSRDSLEELCPITAQYVRLMTSMTIGRRLRSKVDYSDLTQSVMLKVHTGLPGFRGDNEAKFLAWLRQIVKNELTQLLRRYHSLKRNVSREVCFSDADQFDPTRGCDARLASTDTPSRCAIITEQYSLNEERLSKLINNGPHVVLRRFDHDASASI